jgi:hypothetical protein
MCKEFFIMKELFGFIGDLNFIIGLKIGIRKFYVKLYGFLRYGIGKTVKVFYGFLIYRKPDVFFIL